eukprot:TRINITY_DN731_c0_g1_i1.p1 TRINITY_DN731_c0_g1~~TRINITY_DN731_c0_g1_i1.p1  ORF type:complete len:131 (-),score=28.68 TRINITY_DN731_c0_g1_i1:49-441(-)
MFLAKIFSSASHEAATSFRNTRSLGTAKSEFSNGAPKDNLAKPQLKGRIPKRSEAQEVIHNDEEASGNSVDDIINITEPVEKERRSRGAKFAARADSDFPRATESFPETKSDSRSVPLKDQELSSSDMRK